MRQTHFVVVTALSAALSGCVEESMQQDMEPTGPAADSPRVVDALQVLYTFSAGKGLVVKDESGIEPAFDLELDNLVTNNWLPDGGIQIIGPSVITSREVAEKIFAACVQSNAVTLEAWIEPADNTQQASILAYEKDGQRNAALTVDTSRYRGQVLTASPDPMMAGEMIREIDTIQTPENVAAPAVQHVVYTRDAEGAALYVNGVDTKPPSTGTTPPMTPEPLKDHTEWSPAYQLVIGNVTSGNDQWLGKVYLVAVYAKKFTAADAAKNFSAGH